MLIHQVAAMNQKRLQFLTDDIKENMLMQPTSCITTTYHRQISIMPNVLSTHVLSECHRLGNSFGIGKPAVIKA